jgi:hypothetical protein
MMILPNRAGAWRIDDPSLSDLVRDPILDIAKPIVSTSKELDATVPTIRSYPGHSGFAAPRVERLETPHGT